MSLYVPKIVEIFGENPYGFKGDDNDIKLDYFTVYGDADSKAIKRAQKDGLYYEIYEPQE